MTDLRARLDRAISMGEEALTRLGGHEKVCGDRYDNIDGRLEEMKATQLSNHTGNDDRLGRIERRLAWLTGAGAVVLIVGQIIARLVIH